MATTPLPAWLSREEFPFDPELIDLGSGEAISVTDVGSGEPILFSHGTPTWSYEWRHHLLGLRADYRCIAPDHLGFGLSPRPSSADYSPEAHAGRFEALLERLDLPHYTLVVHDFGGPIALAAALKRPERIRRLVLYNTFAGPLGDTSERARVARMAGGGLFRFLYRNANLSVVIAKSAWGDRTTMTRGFWTPYKAPFPDKDSRELVLFALARALAGSADFMETTFRELRRLSEIPVHLVWGMKDSAFPPHVLLRFREAFPNASRLELERSGHFPHEEEPRVCVESVREFLARTD